MTIKAQNGPGRQRPEPAIYVALAVSAMPEPAVGSERMRCACCAEPVWVDPLRYAPARLSERSLRVLCTECAAELAAKWGTAGEGESRG